MLGIAILGVGDIANIHINSYLELKGRCEIKALVDVYRNKAEEKAQKYNLNCEVFEDYHELLTRDDIDLVSICLPPSMHCQAAVDFLMSGKHVLCEKPMAQTLEECDKMIEAATIGGGKLSILAQNRFKTDIMKTKQLIDSGVLGELYFAGANSLWWRGDNYYDLWWRGTWEKEGGGCSFIHAVHHIDLFLWLMGNVHEVTSLVSNQNHHNSEVEDVSITTVRFENGAVGTLVSSLLHHGEEQSIIIDTQNASIQIPHKISVSKQLQNGYPEPDIKAKEAIEEIYNSFPELSYTEHCGQIENMVTAIETNTMPLITGEDGRKTIEFIMGIYQSAFTGKPVQFPMTEKDLFYTKEGFMSKVIKFNKKTKSVENFQDIGISVGGTL
ncbi:Gfo/Idh/MocA family protein [Lachnoclostridium phytofermentans]|uniref:Oxidoreductase domain protein n=1 Tax=Lachnoclostridium phytofermentans (strain ATCC 700394 / DSM 18823 / ISDg) TaxID=357809 RepID=A9KIY7_LACP7|nr:Gfo/Idh/MocA family oxidoreductase [Lachnoclostridium phytofermentans]ABX40986.1 oxidoreductase domain protein [Lachnoclostridium phytofermentans ISDg]